MFALIRHGYTNSIGKYFIRIKNIFYSYSSDDAINCSGFFLTIKPINQESIVFYLPARQGHKVHSMCLNNLDIKLDNYEPSNLAVVANGLEPSNYTIIVDYEIIERVEFQDVSNLIK